MIPKETGYYWIKHYGYDGTGGKSISDWFIAYYEGELSWSTLGDEVGFHEDGVVMIGPKLEPPLD